MSDDEEKEEEKAELEEEEEDEDGEDLGKYDFNFDSDPELVEKVESLKKKVVTIKTVHGAGSGSTAGDESE